MQNVSRRLAVAKIQLDKVFKGAVDRAVEENKEVFDELLRLAQEQAWTDGYQACYNGQQRHNPYRKANPDASNTQLRSTGDTATQNFSNQSG
jgi:hypothetical protein